MSLPAETKFPCQLMPDRDSVTVNFIELGRILVECRERKDLAGSFMDRAQVESLRDKLTEWLEVTK